MALDVLALSSSAAPSSVLEKRGRLPDRPAVLRGPRHSASTSTGTRARASATSCSSSPKGHASACKRIGRPGRRARRDRGADARPRAAAALPARRRPRRTRGVAVRATAARTSSNCRPSRSTRRRRATSTTRSRAERLDGGGIRIWVHIADVAALRAARLARRPRGAPARARASTSPARSSRCSPRRCPTTPARSSRRSSGWPSPPSSTSTATRSCGRRSTARSSAPTRAWTTRRSTAIFAGTERAAGAVGRAARGRARGGRGARGAARGAGRARGQLDRAGVHLRQGGPRARARARGADGVAPPDRAPDDRRQRGGRRAARGPQAAGALPRPRAAGRRPRATGSPSSSSRSTCRRRALSEHLSPTQALEAVGDISRARRAHGTGKLGFTFLVLRSLKQAYYTPRNNGHAGLRSRALLPLHLADPPLPRPRRAPRAARGDRRGRGACRTAARSRSSAPGARPASATRCPSSASADDVARCFLLEQRLFDDGWEQEFEGEVTSVIGAGAFIAFGDGFEGMLPVRRLRGDWWELNELRDGAAWARSPSAAIRIGDSAVVQVVKVDTARGRVDLSPVQL